jgi:hypothetical protein
VLVCYGSVRFLSVSCNTVCLSVGYDKLLLHERHAHTDVYLLHFCHVSVGSCEVPPYRKRFLPHNPLLLRVTDFGLEGRGAIPDGRGLHTVATLGPHWALCPVSTSRQTFQELGGAGSWCRSEGYVELYLHSSRWLSGVINKHVENFYLQRNKGNKQKKA